MQGKLDANLKGVWLLVTVFGGLITTVVTGLFAPAAGAMRSDFKSN